MSPMRQILSTAIVAVIVGALAGVTASAIAQAPDEVAIGPSAVSNINADKVDGKHAVGYPTKKTRRAGKLVATNSAGKLPSNIVDPFWGGIQNIPAGFADGTDDGITAITTQLATNANAIAASGSSSTSVSCPAGTKVLNGGGTASSFGVHMVSSFQTGNGWIVAYQNTTPVAGSITVIATCATYTPTPAISTAGQRIKPADLLPK